MPTLTAPLLPTLASLPDFAHTFGSVALGILGIGLLIFVHELGHFLACRLTKTRVETFSIGFGPRLFGWETRGGVRRFGFGPRRAPASEGGLDIRISAIPLGGYVKMAGEIGGDGSASSGVGEEPRAPRPDEFPGKPFAARAFIICAGVLMNILAAFVLYVVAYAKGLDDVPPLVGGVVPGEAAWSAGLQPGDRILSFGGARIRSFNDFRQEVLFTSRTSKPTVVVERGGAKVETELHPRYDEEAGLQQAGVYPVAAWNVNDGASPAFTVGPTEAATVEGRPVVGGSAAALAAHDAWVLGKRTIVVTVAGAGGAPVSHEVRLPSIPADAKAQPGVKLGIVPARLLVVERTRPDGAADRAGMKPGDRVIGADGRGVSRPQDLTALSSIGRLELLRDGKPVSVEVHVEGAPAVAAFLDSVALGAKVKTGEPAAVLPQGETFADGKSPAGEAGIKPGETIVAIGEKPVATWEELLERVKDLTSTPVPVRVRAVDGTERTVTVTPQAPRDTTKVEEFFQGEAALVTPHEKVVAGGPLDALSLAGRREWGEVRNIFRMIGRFVGGEISPGKNLGGPGTIVNLSSRTVHEGLSAFLAFLAFISINLAVLNILPIPVLDGGSLLLLVIEKLRGGRPLKETTIGYLQWAGFAALMLLMVFAIKNDFGNLSR